MSRGHEGDHRLRVYVPLVSAPVLALVPVRTSG
jgi:hypothetical protein